ncbi:DUF1080 domain-containing protein, partial [candidate division KSB1 bacterium]|nr:DUF1080 domain-containing protein [candidate division KSB1 bacterium]
KTFTNMTYAVNIRTAESLSANPDTEIGIIFCYQDESNFYYVSFSSEDNATVLLMRKNGQDIVLARTDIPIIQDYDYISVAVTIIDGVIKVSTEDYNLFHIYNNTFTSGKIGVGVADDAAYFDKVVVCKEVENTCDYYENFNDNNLNGWTALNPLNWYCAFRDYTYVIYLTKSPASAKPDHLGEIITIDHIDAENFTLEFDLKSISMPDGNPNADLAVVWCYIDAKNYYTAIFHRQSGGTKWLRILNDNVTTIRQYPEALLIDQEWHHVKIAALNNYYKIYFDDKLVMDQYDSYLTSGKIGFGSLNDPGWFDNICITGDLGPESISLSTPNGGEVLKAGEMCTINWLADKVINNVMLEYTTDGGASWANIIPSTPQDNQFDWEAPVVNSSKCKVRIQDIDGFPVDESDDFFTIAAPPQTPVLSSPANGATNVSTSPLLSWNAVSGAASYQLQVSTNSGFTSVVFDQSAITATSFPVSGLNNNMTYYWRVNATNAGGTSTWSSAWNFTTVSAPPLPPTLSSPANGATNVHTSLSVIWNAASGATSYGLQVSTNSEFTSFVVDQSAITSTSYPVSGLNNSTTYYWRVNATNDGGTSAWSSVWHFMTSGATNEPPISFEGPDKVAAGAEFTLYIQVGSAAKPVSNLKIVSMEILYTNTSDLDYVSYMIGPFLTDAGAQVIAEDANGKLSASVFKTSGGNSGNGVILRLTFKSLTQTPEGTAFTFTFKEVQAQNANNEIIPLSPLPKTVTIESGVLVWPGDADNSGRVNIFDINPIVANYWGKTGPARPNASYNWAAQSCPPWNPVAATFADCSGEGVISIFDINPVIINFNKTHALNKTAGVEQIAAKSQVLDGPPLTLTPDKTVVAPNEEFWIDVIVGSEQSPVDRLKILSFEMTYDTTKYMDYVAYELGLFLTNSSGQVIPEDENGKISCSVYKTSGSNSGNGVLVRFSFKISETAPENLQIHFNIGQFLANDEDGNIINMTAPDSLTIEIISSAVAQFTQMPQEFVLHQNHPNPFNPSTQIDYELPVQSRINLAIYNVVGQLVEEMTFIEQDAGIHHFTWRPNGESGIYFCRLEAIPLQGESRPFMSTVKMLFTK